MTRKDYVLLAEPIKRFRLKTLQDYQDASTETGSQGTMDHCASMLQGVAIVAQDIADALKRENQAFDKDRFLKAAGVAK